MTEGSTKIVNSMTLGQSLLREGLSMFYIFKQDKCVISLKPNFSTVGIEGSTYI